MAGQSANMSIGKARSAAKGAGYDLGCNHGGSIPKVPNEGMVIGQNEKGNSASAGDHTGKKSKKAKHSY